MNSKIVNKIYEIIIPGIENNKDIIILVCFFKIVFMNF
jgi:hypothetical protein